MDKRIIGCVSLSFLFCCSTAFSDLVCPHFNDGKVVEGVWIPNSN